MSSQSQQQPFAAGTPTAHLAPVSQSPITTPSAHTALGVERRPGIVALLTIVTLGFYLIYWWYAVNREMRDFARSVQPTHPLANASPATATVALTLGSLIIVPPSHVDSPGKL